MSHVAPCQRVQAHCKDLHGLPCLFFWRPRRTVPHSAKAAKLRGIFPGLGMAIAYTLRARLCGWYFHENRKVHMRSILCCVFVKLSRQLGDPRRFDFLKALKTLSQVKQGRSSRIRQQSCGPRLACTSTRSATEHSAPFFRNDKMTLKRKRFHSLTTAAYTCVHTS